MKNMITILFAVAACLGAYALCDLGGINAASSQNAFPVDCQEENGEMWAELENARPGITEYEQCYAGNPAVPGGPLQQPYCIQGYAWWTEGTDTVWVFCNASTLGQVIFYR